MQNTVPTQVKPSGGIVAPSIPTQPTTPDPLESALRSAFDQGEPCDADGNSIVEQEPAAAWRSTIGTVSTAPIHELLQTLGVRIVEVQPEELAADGIVGRFSGRVGDGEIQIVRTLPQADRESVVRDLLARITPARQSYTKRAPARSAIVFGEHRLADGVPLLYGRKDGALRVTFDPAQISFESARELFNEADSLFPGARAVAFTNVGRTVIADLPADELPVRIEQHGKGRCTVTYDDTRITGEQLIALMDEAAGR